MRNSFLSIILCAGLTALQVDHGRSSEFGNVFGDGGVSRASSEASALALMALETTLAGIRQRELGETPGLSELKIASDMLREAASKMESIASGEFGEFGLTEISREMIQGFERTIAESVDAFGLSFPKTIQELYTEFSRSTYVMADILEKNAIEDGTPIFPRLSMAIRQYLAFGEAVTVISNRSLN